MTRLFGLKYPLRKGIKPCITRSQGLIAPNSSIHKPSKPSNLNMQFKLSAVFVALAAAAAVSAVAVKRDDAATCTLVFTPSAAVDPSTDLNSEFNFGESSFRPPRSPVY